MSCQNTATLTTLGQMASEIAALAVQAERQAAEQDPSEVAWSSQHQQVSWHEQEYWVCYTPLFGLVPCPICEREIASGVMDIAGGPHGGTHVTFETMHVLTDHGHDLQEADPEWKKGLMENAARLRNTLGA